MITKGLISLLKEQNDGHKLLYVRFSNDEFVFRSLNKKEYKEILFNYENEKDINEYLCTLACIYPEGYEFRYCEYAGFPDVIGPKIKDLSGFNDLSGVISMYN